MYPLLFMLAVIGLLASLAFCFSGRGEWIQAMIALIVGLIALVLAMRNYYHDGPSIPHETFSDDLLIRYQGEPQEYTEEHFPLTEDDMRR